MKVSHVCPLHTLLYVHVKQLWHESPYIAMYAGLYSMCAVLHALYNIQVCIIAAERRSAYLMHAHYISDQQKHVFEPIMMRCLEERPAARGRFEDAMEDIYTNSFKEVRKA